MGRLWAGGVTGWPRATRRAGGRRTDGPRPRRPPGGGERPGRRSGVRGREPRPPLARPQPDLEPAAGDPRRHRPRPDRGDRPRARHDRTIDPAHLHPVGRLRRRCRLRRGARPPHRLLALGDPRRRRLAAAAVRRSQLLPGLQRPAEHQRRRPLQRRPAVDGDRRDRLGHRVPDPPRGRPRPRPPARTAQRLPGPGLADPTDHVLAAPRRPARPGPRRHQGAAVLLRATGPRRRRDGPPQQRSGLHRRRPRSTRRPRASRSASTGPATRRPSSSCGSPTTGRPTTSCG